VSPVVKVSRWRFWGSTVCVISKGKKRSRLQLSEFSSCSRFMRPIAGLSDVIWGRCCERLENTRTTTVMMVKKTFLLPWQDNVFRLWHFHRPDGRASSGHSPRSASTSASANWQTGEEVSCD